MTEWNGQNPTPPKCPVCGRVGDWPNRAIALADVDGVFRATVFSRQRVFICQADGAVFVGQWSGPWEHGPSR